MKGVRVGRSGVSGRGLFATRVFEPGQTICEYSGRLFKGELPYDARYLFTINSVWTLDGSPMSNIGRWANHSCRPNAHYDVSQRKRVWLYAIKTIRPGDEVVYDYGMEYRTAFLRLCLCAHCIEQRAYWRERQLSFWAL